MVGRLLRLDLIEPHYRAQIERTDIDTIHMNRYLELWVAPHVVDIFLEQKGEGKIFLFKVENGTIVAADLVSNPHQAV
jgi:hypothetical protein